MSVETTAQEIRTEVAKAIVGQNEVIEQLLVAILAGREERQRGSGSPKSRSARHRNDHGRRAAQQRYQRELGRLIRETASRHVWRALHSPYPVREHMTWFWFNHFNVFVGKAQVREYLPAYERDVIRPHVLGRFRDLLGAVAHSPAMLLYLDNSFQRFVDAGRMATRADLWLAVHDGAVKRIRPKAMTVAAAFVGLVPLLWAHGTGADVMRRLAAPMIGGLLISFLVELVLYPVIYYLYRSMTERHRFAEEGSVRR